MKNTSKHLTDPPTKEGSIAFLRDLVGHIERGEVTIEKAFVDYDATSWLGNDRDLSRCWVRGFRFA